MSTEDFTVVPILDNFDSGKVIGEMRILTAALPSTEDFVFTIGYTLSFGIVGAFGRFELNDAHSPRYQLRAISIVKDEAYIAFLKNTGKI